jgi:aspartyl-tRNA(Asn)/glutamyl-tRNA(Gln) amidotransferase subunit C
MITTSEVEKIAKLAKLTFSSEEITNFAKEFSSIMKMIDKLNELDCQDVVPLTSLADAKQALRSDSVTENDIAEELFANAPGKTADFAKEIKCFVVPKMIE